MDYNLEATPLLVRYTAAPDTALKFVNLYSSTSALLGWVQWGGGAVNLRDCEGAAAWTRTPKTTANQQTWRVTKTETQFTLHQDGVLVFSYQFGDSCPGLRGNVVSKIGFNKFASLSSSYKPYSGEITRVGVNVTLL